MRIGARFYLFSLFHAIIRPPVSLRDGNVRRLTHNEEVMKNIACLSLFFLFFATLQAEEINVDSLISAHKAGLSSDTIIKLVSDPNNTTAPFTNDDLERLKAAGVPQNVIDSFTQKATKTFPPAARPENNDLYALVTLVESGLSETIIIDQINQSGVSQKPTMTDLIFLKEKMVPEIVIVALMNARVGERQEGGLSAAEAHPTSLSAAVKTATVDQDSKASFDGLIYKKAFFGYSGKLVLEDGKLSGEMPKKVRTALICSSMVSAK